jgi:hypothetical protein
MSALGALLAYMGVVELRPYRYTNFFAPVAGLLTLLWSAGLMIFGIKGVVNAIRPHRREGSVV